MRKTDMNQVLIDTVHDVIVQLKDIEPSKKAILEVISLIPEEILFIGRQWGYSDTVFGDKIYEWLSNNNCLLQKME